MDARGEGYVVPTYTAPEDTTWYHFLHGNVPGHQIDFMYRPEVPQGALTRQHFSHLSRLMKYIEPHTNSPYAFAIGNLSRDDTQYEPGHGGIALIFGLRVRGVTDHAGRQDPPFAHAIAAVDRELDYRALLDSAMSFYRHMFSREYDNPCTVMYREYVRYAGRNPEVLPTVLKAYTADFEELPAPQPSSLSLQWRTNEAPQPKRIVIVHPDNAPFGDLAECAARIAAVLYRSDIRWTAISNGRESDLPNGVSIRFVAKSDAAQYESGGPVMRLEEVPDTEAEIAEKLFGATPVVQEEEVKRAPGWRELYKGSPRASLPPGGVAAGGDGARYGKDSNRPPASVRNPYGGRSAAEGAVGAAGAYEVNAAQAPGLHEAQGRARPWENPTNSTATQVLGDEFIEVVDGGAGRANGVDARSAAVLERPKPPELTALRTGGAANTSTNAGLGLGRLPEEPPKSRLWLWLGLGAVCVTVVALAATAITHTEKPAPVGGPEGAPTTTPSDNVKPPGETVQTAPSGVAPNTGSVAPAPSPSPSASPGSAGGTTPNATTAPPSTPSTTNATPAVTPRPPQISPRNPVPKKGGDAKEEKKPGGGVFTPTF